MENIEIEDIIDEKYKIDRQIDQGGFGIVYEATDLVNKNKVALKSCKRDEPDVQTRFAREIRIMENIDHPNVMKILDYNLDADLKYFVMPLAKYSLYDVSDHLIADHVNTLNIFLEVCKGLSSIHSTGHIHRDIKPQNILVNHDGQIVISDFGLGMFEERDSTIVTSSHDFLGTQAYAPPEYMVRGGVVNADVKGDIYQLGKTLYFLLTGKDPFLLENDSLPRGIENIITKATKPNPDLRYKSVAELADYIETYLYSLNPTHSPEYRFEIDLKQCEDLAAEGTFNKKIVEDLLTALYDCKDDEQKYLDLFDKIPANLLEIIPKQLVDEFKPILDTYTHNLDYMFENLGYHFAYAEIISSKMRLVYKSSKDLELKKIALKNILVSSYLCNRWAAMDVFDNILSNISETSEAMAIAEMLREEIKVYAHMANRLQKHELHPAIQIVQSEALGEDFDHSTNHDINLP